MLKVKDIMTKKAVVINQDTGVKEICQILIKNKLSGVPVVGKKQKLVGFISERDIIGKVPLRDFLTKKAKDLMTKKVVSLCYNMTTEEAARIFTERPYRVLPVIKENKVIGIVSRKDIIEKLLGQYY